MQTQMVSRKLPLELEEEILIRVPPPSLARFRAVCKQWNALFDDKIFVKNHWALSRSEFILQTDSKIYSLSFNVNDEDPNIKVCEFPSIGIPGLGLENCDGFFFLDDNNRTTAVWNPWLRQTKLVEIKYNPFLICGVGYDSSRPEKSYKILGYTYCRPTTYQPIHFRTLLKHVIYEFATNAWKFIDGPLYDRKSHLPSNAVSLNGNLYWVTYHLKTLQYFIRIFDCSKEIFKPFCILPCKKKDSYHTPVLAVFKEDRFSLLEQCKVTKKIEIWVTEKKIINGDHGDDVEWIKFMSVSIPNLPMLHQDYEYSRFKYLVDDNIYGKSFVMCCSDETRQACVYIVRGDMCRKIILDDVVGELQRCSVYSPSLMIPNP